VTGSIGVETTPIGAWTLVVPVKRLARAKTRLVELPVDLRAELALAFAADTVAAALQCPLVDGVVVVTDEPAASVLLSSIGADVVADTPDAGLNPALIHGAVEAKQLYPVSGVGALSADLPALRPGELEHALDLSASVPASFVADGAGVGTTLLVARSLDEFRPQFGPRSRAKHRAAGAREIESDALATLRRDVDTQVDLWDADRLGLGPRTQAVLASLPG
jgi:2-phospho-L-lactate/phosphoenolpyruvate guanylyltransferase